VKQAILTGTLAFKNPVLLQNGDEHWVQLDIDPSNPLLWTIIPKLVASNFAKH